MKLSRRLTDEEARPVMLAAGLEPLEPYPGGDRPWKSVHIKCGKETCPRFRDIRKGIGPCKHCSRVYVDPSVANQTMDAVGLFPSTVYPGSAVPWPCICVACGSQVSPTYSDIRQGRSKGCKFCRNRAVHPEDMVRLLKEAGYEPSGPYPGHHVKWESKHILCGRTVFVTCSAIKRGEGCCTYCALFGGIRSDDYAEVYIVANQRLLAIKIGIAKLESGRVSRHNYHGWETLHTWDNIIGSIAFAAESRVLRNWRKAGIPIACTKEQMPQGGWTETAPLDMVDIAKVRRWVNYEIRKQKI